jgi:3',5'-cyclic AMP phosphodiesterase CpdA
MPFLPLLLNWLCRGVGALLSLLMTFSLPAPAGETIAPEREDVRLQFAVFSDVHMESFTWSRFTRFARCLRDLGAGTQKPDALVLLGDNTMNGQPFEYLMLYGLLSRYQPARRFVAAMGNHDLNRSAYTPAAAIARHDLFLKAYTGAGYGTPYYETTVNGYPFLVLGDEAPHEDTTATLTQTQLDWFARALRRAAATEKPIFVFCHQPLDGTFSGKGLGEQSRAVLDLMLPYKNVFFFSGHLHTPPQDCRIVREGNVTMVNVPTLLSNEAAPGFGYQAEVYADGVLLRGRDYLTGTWQEHLRFDFGLAP